MRRNFTKLPSSSSPFITFASRFSTSSSGRGRGRGLISTQFSFVDEKPTPPPSSPSENKPPPSGFGHGHAGGGGAGRGKPFTFTPPSPSPTVFSNPGLGRGRGLGPDIGSSNLQPTPPPPPPAAQRSDPTTPSARDNRHLHASIVLGRPPNSNETNLSASIHSIVSNGAGRGKVLNPSAPSAGPSIKPKEENRHVRPRQPPARRENNAASRPPQQPLSKDEAFKKAVGILSKDGGEGPAARGGRGGGFRGGRGREMWRGQGGAGGRGGGKGRSIDDSDDDSEDHDFEEDDYESGLYLGDDADVDKLAKRFGPDVWNQIVEGFDEMGDRVLPSPFDDAYEEALCTNLKIECEPEYQMGNFESNPDIDEKPQMSLREALDKVKPFIMAYENIQSHEEWEEAVEEVMKKVPVLKDIVDLYGGPDRVTAKQQQQELLRVADMIPERAPPPIKRFTQNAVLSLQVASF
ncbi:OLC1v1015850C1 [Oldenlandia corymbosa var. corymbosa]|uniref:OLC1v1015850C1 n=1 Tax=Oldenlandia corymbosa var. corymbosa TaxID=529605 RepID=A0AAV1E714_OLDCO|nr:OLC1v1015850C1 [Oldenlandia corymbosa var. corymbosa]